MVNVAVLGAAGRMGVAVCEAVAAAPSLTLVAAIDPSYTARLGHPIETDDLSRMVEVGADVAIDFTHKQAAMENLAACAESGIHAVVGTSGFTEHDFAAIEAQFVSSNCLIAPNFAIGAVLLMRFAELAAPHFETAEIIELHHDGKVDAPSGTAVGTAERMAAASDDWAADPTTTETIAGARGAKGPADIRVHSVRMRGMVAHQEVILGAAGQTLTLRHDSYDRSSFMPGVVLAAERVGDLPDRLTVGLDSVLGI